MGRTSVVREYIEKRTWRINENANRIPSIGGLKTYIAEKTIAKHTLSLYPKEVREAHLNAAIHIHDLGHGIAGYSFYRNDVVIVRRKSDGKLLTLCFEQLFETVDSQIIEEDGYQIKYTDDYEILDEHGWTPLICVMRHKAERPLLSISAKDGENIILTEDHPFITIHHRKPHYKCPFCGSEKIVKYRSNARGVDLYECKDCLRRFKKPRERIGSRKREIIKAAAIEVGNYAVTPLLQLNREVESKISEEDAWFIGLYIAEGWQDEYRIYISQNKESEEFKKLIDYLKRRGIPYSTVEDDLYINKSALPGKIKRILSSIRCGAENKNLPPEFLNYPDEVVGALISGIIDGDGTLSTHDKYCTPISLRMTARTLLSQIFIWLKLHNIKARLRPIKKTRAREYQGHIIESKKQMYELCFYIPPEKIKLFAESIKVGKKLKVTSKSRIYSIFTPITKIETIENDDGWVYDITTTTHTFICNGILVHNCSGWSLLKILMKGFYGGNGTIKSKPPKHFTSTLAQLLNFIGVISQEWAGAQAVNSFDTLLAPFIRYDGLSYRQVKQALQEFIFSLNVALRYGHETPFTNITFDLTTPSDLKNAPVIIGGEPQSQTYDEFEEEREMINKAFLEVLYEGDADGAVFRFPIPTYNITKDFGWDGGFGEILAKATGMFGVPYFQNCVSSGIHPEDVRAMCCFRGDTLVFWRKNGQIHLTTFQQLHQYHKGEVVETLYNGKWVKCRVVQVPYEHPFYKIKLRNGFEIIVTDDHEHITREGIKTTAELTTDDYLAWSKKSPEWGGVGDYDLGYFLGLYLAEGSHLGKTGIQFSIASNEEDIKEFIQNYANMLGANTTIEPNTGDSISIFIHAKWIREMIDSWIGERKATEKYVKNWTKLSKEALRGLWNGLMRGDGCKDETVIYTSSPRLARELMCIANVLNIPVNLQVWERHARLKGKEYKGKIYGIHICKSSDDGGRIYYTGSSLYSLLDCYWVKIESIERVSNRQKKAYCFEVLTDEHLFELPQGLITHNCRLNLDLRELRRKTGGLFGYNDETGSIGVVTINLAQIGFLARDDSDFFEMLDERLEIAKEALELKRQIVAQNFERGLLPYTSQYLHTLDNHFSTIGVVGGEEMCLNFLECSIADEDGKNFAVKVLKHIRSRIEGFQRETGHLYNLEATPAEGCSYRLAKIDRKRFGRKIITSGTAKAPFYTNSTQLPVDCDFDLIDMLKHQEELQCLYTGGTVFHVFLGEGIPESQCYGIVPNFITWLCTKFKLPYYTLTPTYSVCRKCSKRFSGEVRICEQCGSECEVFSRVVGYYSPTHAWNVGKKEEWKRRRLLNVGEIIKR